MSQSRPSDTFQPGDLLNNTYRIEAVLGRGGTSEVYRARSEISGRFVALKVLKSEFSGDQAFLSLMTREEAMRDIRHDAVVRYSENHRTPDGHVYLIMDYIDGPGLDEKLRTGGMGADDLLVVMARVAEGLQAAHSRNVVHRDLSPDNIILRGGDPAQAVIIDFGIAKDENPGAETIVGNEFAGKYAYAAPEQLSGRTDARTDIYSLGALILAVFRGKVPDVGRNPMEVIRNKMLPLDTEGVPEPLRSILDQMTQPEPEKRLQTALAVLEAIDPTYSAPVTARRPVTQPPARPAAAPVAQQAMAAPLQPRRGNGPLLAGVAALVLMGAGAAGWQAGLFGGSAPAPEATASAASATQEAPAAEPAPTSAEPAAQEAPAPVETPAAPLTFAAERAAGGGVSVSGTVPSEDARAALLAAVGAGATGELAVAEGSAPGSFGPDLTRVIAALAPLKEWRLETSGNALDLTGTAQSDADRAAVDAVLSDPALSSVWTVTARIGLAPLLLDAGQVRAAVDRHADCGPLTLIDPPEAGYGPQDQIAVTGSMADPATKVALNEELVALAQGRPVAVGTEVLNAKVCTVEARLPKLAAGPMVVNFMTGDQFTPNPTGRYFVGENPVIDVVLPSAVTTGHLWVAVIDVSGNVYNLLPNLGRPDASVAGLRNGMPGDVAIRVAYSIAQSKENGGLAFSVDDTTLGKSKILVLYSDKPVFDDPRPTTESVEGFAAALAERAEQGKLDGLSLSSRILVTQQR